MKHLCERKLMDPGGCECRGHTRSSDVEERPKPRGGREVPILVADGLHGKRRAKKMRCVASVVRWALLALVLVLLQTAGAATAKNVDSTVNSLKEGVCQSMDIRNDVKEFMKLKGCRVIEGWLQILLLEKTTVENFNNLVFPDLIEITGYLMVYRVQGLRSIGSLFPNLTVIRGHQLFVNYALVVYEMTHLQEIGLHSLTDITRGSVRFETNSVLCYADTINWDIIAKNGKGENVIRGNKPKNECPVCEKHCPIRPDKPDERLCWNKQHCQKFCPQCDDNACNERGECCHKSCLGGCTGPSNRNCTVCRQVVVDNNQCVPSCPSNTFEFRSRRCIQQHECRMMRRPLEMSATVRDQPYKPFGNNCIIDCPPGFEEKEISPDNYSCTPCNGPCLKECLGNIVDSIASAQRLRGCTHINGNLEITIHEGQNVVRELEESLSSIEVITGYLKIFRSYPLMSLNFLRNLKEIRGSELVMNKYTLFVLDNQNLQELWNWTARLPLKIGSKNDQPKVSFHFNPKLCLHTIELLRQKTGIAEFTDIEVSTESNGDKVACNVTEMRTYVASVSWNACVIKWEPFRHHDPRTLLGYVVYYKEAPTRNISLYDSRDACGGDGWRVEDLAASGTDDDRRYTYNVSKSDDKFASYTSILILTGLKPFTQYAYYVKTYTISTERSGAQSALTYFTTRPGTPSTVRGLSIISNSSDSLVISWKPPSEPNGELVYYDIVGEIENYDPVYLAQRDYCVDVMMPQQEMTPKTTDYEEQRRREEEEQKLSQLELEGGCECTKKEKLQSEKEALNAILFEDALHNSVYIKRSSRRRRDLGASVMFHSVPKKSLIYGFIEQDKDKDVFNQSKKISLNSQLKNAEPKDTTWDDGSIVKFKRTVRSTETTFVMRQLRHFGKYNIKVRACRDKKDNPENYCSSAAMKSVQTLRRDGADDIPASTFTLEKTMSNDSSTVIKLFWKEPERANGIIVAYQIQYKRVDVANYKTIPACVTGTQFREDKFTYTMPTLPPGNYSIKVQATSFAGVGAFSETLYFHIPNSGSRTTVGDIAFYIFLAFLFFTLIATLSIYVFRKKFMRNVPSMRLIATVNPEYVSTVYIPDEWEIPRKKIQLLRELGNGSFGMVYEGLAKELLKGKSEMKCAVKTVNENATDRERIEFLNEASVMKGFNTHHVVRLLGVVSQGQPTLVVMELMANGDLKSYLRSHRPDYCENFSRQPPTLKEILKMAIEIADGMAYLAAKKFVHRDLAARNCMVDQDMTVKIGDFGMTRDIYETDYYRKGTKGLLPVRWMAPESLKDGVFTSFSDVWSYGVVLWEMVTLASQPYQGLSNDQVLRYVIDGGVMEGPENCPDSLYNLMRQTWHHKATRRPTFIDIETLLLSEVDQGAFERVSFYHSPEGQEALNQNNSQFFHSDKDLELVTLEELKEEENEAEENEDSPLRRDLNNFGMTPFTETTNSIMGDYLDLNSSKAPLKAGFDDFDGISVGSLASSKDTLDLPFAEEGLNLVRASPFSQQKKSTSKGSVEHISNRSYRSVSSPQSAKSAITKADPDYENREPEKRSKSARSSPRISCQSVNNAEDNETLEVSTAPGCPPVVSITVESDQKQARPPEVTIAVNTKIEQQQPPSLNNGYISGTTT